MAHTNDTPYITNFSQLDAQHRRILEIIDTLGHQLKTEDSHDNCITTCTMLVNALRHHYDEEERLMLKHFYPDTENHIGQHMNYLLLFGKLLKQLQNHQLDSAQSTLVYMRSWLLDHTYNADKKYADFIHSQSA